MLDDATFASAWVESRDRARPRGERALRLELRQKGIDPDLVATVLEERRAAADPSDGGDPDLDGARRLLARHARTLGRIADPRVRRARAYALLARQGFDPDVCRVVSVEATGAAADPASDAGVDD